MRSVIFFFVIASPSFALMDFYWLVVSSDQFLKIHPGAAQRFLKSLLLAENFVKTNPVKSQQIIENRFSISQKFFKQNWPKHKFSVTLSQALLVTMEGEARWAITNKSTNKTIVPNYLNFIYFDALTKIKPEAVGIIH